VQVLSRIGAKAIEPIVETEAILFNNQKQMNFIAKVLIILCHENLNNTEFGRKYQRGWPCLLSHLSLTKTEITGFWYYFLGISKQLEYMILQATKI